VFNLTTHLFIDLMVHLNKKKLSTIGALIISTTQISWISRKNDNFGSFFLKIVCFCMRNMLTFVCFTETVYPYKIIRRY